MAQKVLQLYRSTNIWLSKNMAKAQVEIHAKTLHEGLKDGEPIVARFYDRSAGNAYTFSYNTTALSGDPYAVSTSANHVWVDGFDELPAIPQTVNYDSAAYIRIPVPGTPTTYTYYALQVTPTTDPVQTDKLGVSSIFGVVYDNELASPDNKMYIEWFDSAADAQGVIDKLKYTDVDLTNGFVGVVHQKNGKIEPIHGTISGDRAIHIEQSPYKYISIGTTAPAEWEQNDENHGSAFPLTIDETSPKYFYLDTASGDYTVGYYELRKDVSVSLVISDNTNNVLTQGTTQAYSWVEATETPSGTTWVNGVNDFADLTSAGTATINSPRVIRVGTTGNYTYYNLTITNTTAQPSVGLATNMTLRPLDPNEIANLSDGSNVKEAYKLVGTASGSEIQIGSTIKIYKDSSLYTAYLGHLDDTLTNADQQGESPDTTITSGTGADALCFIYQLANGKYKLVAVDVESFLSENEFRDGLEVKGANPHYIDYEGTPDVPSDYWVSSGDNQNSFDNRADALAGASATTSEYRRYTLDSGVTYHYLRKESGKEVYVKLSQTGGLEFKSEGEGVNQSVGIKIDQTARNRYYRLYDSSTDSGMTRYNYDPTNASADAYGYVEAVNGNYVFDTYLHTDSEGLYEDQKVLENKITDNTGKNLKVNGEGFNKQSNGELHANVTANDIHVAGDESTKTASVMASVYNAGNPPSKQLPSSEVEGYDFVEYDGKIYKWDSSLATPAYVEYNINASTNLNEAIAILNYLAYNLDMGTFTI